MMIAKEGDIQLREFTDSDLIPLSEYANNDNVSLNLRDAFPKPYTLHDAANFKKMIDSQSPMTFFAIEYRGAFVGSISLSIWGRCV